MWQKKHKQTRYADNALQDRLKEFVITSMLQWTESVELSHSKVGQQQPGDNRC